jgi:hypothetical protein
MGLDLESIDYYKWEPELNYNIFLFLIKFFMEIEKLIHESSIDFFSYLFINSVLRKVFDNDFVFKNERLKSFM